MRAISVVAAAVLIVHLICMAHAIDSNIAAPSEVGDLESSSSSYDIGNENDEPIVRSNYLRRTQQQEHERRVTKILDETSVDLTLVNLSESTMKVMSSEGDRNQDDSSTSIEISIDPQKNVLKEYINGIYFASNFVLIKWDSSGMFNSMTGVKDPHWFDDEDVHSMFQTTQPSEFGRVALLFNSDMIGMLPFDKEPPVPLLLYTAMNKVIGNPMFQLLPSPYDRSGYSFYCVNQILDVNRELYGSITPSYEQFHSRTPIVIWRGTVHSEYELERIRLLEMSYPEAWLLSNDVTFTMPENTNKTLCEDHPGCWIDAVDYERHRVMSMSPRDQLINYKYQMDVGGVSGTSWGGLRWKLCAASLTFKVDTWAQDWWHGSIEPFKHYIPVKSDLSDLKEQFDWAESHPKEVYDIVVAGQKECLRTYDKEPSIERTKYVVQNLIRPSSEEMVREASEIIDQLAGELLSQEL